MAIPQLWKGTPIRDWLTGRSSSWAQQQWKPPVTIQPSQPGGIPISSGGRVVGYQYPRPQALGVTTTQQRQSSGEQLGEGQDLSSLFMPQPEAPGIDFDALIAPALEGLEAAIGPLQQEFATTQQAIEARRGTQIAGTQQQIGAQVGGLEQAKVKQEQLGESAANEARRQFAELQQGIQARYGGTTGTGAFASEIAGSQTFRNVANIRQQVSNAMLEADEKTQQVREIGRIALQDIEDKARADIDTAKVRLEGSLADIRRQRGELQSRKAELALQAMQIYQNTVNQVNQQNAQFKQNLYLTQLEAENSLKLAMQRASQAAQSFNPRDLTSQIESLQGLIGPGYKVSGQVPVRGGGTIRWAPSKEEEEEELFGGG